MRMDGRAGDIEAIKGFELTQLRIIRPFDPWKSPLCTCPRKYSLHPYTGCSHFCLYCYATSYIGLRESKPKKKLVENTARDLSIIMDGSIVELSTSSDPYPPIEREIKLTRKVLELLVKRNTRLLITTKSNLIIRDIDLLKKAKCSVMITITTLDEDTRKIIEPGAPSSIERIDTIKELSKHEIPVGVRIDPVIPFVNDDPADLIKLVEKVIEAGALHVVTSTYKAKWNTLRRLESRLPIDISRKLLSLYRENGNVIHGYIYLPRKTRYKLLSPVIETSKKHNITHAVCREGLMEYNNAPSCDGSHLSMIKESLPS
ncbi:MAG: radical SAM protein [Desulfurococcaceae archaeon]